MTYNEENVLNMLALCGERELVGLELAQPTVKLRALIDGLITQRHRADVAEAEAFKLRGILEWWPNKPALEGEEA